MTLKEQMDADVAGVEPEGQFTFVYQGKDYIGQKSPSMNKLAMVDAGFEADFDFMFYARTSQFPEGINPPANESVITTDDVDYRINSVSPDQYGVVNTYTAKILT